MRVLTLDVGNTTVDACVFEEGVPEPLGKFKHEDIGILPEDYDRVGVVSVKSSLIPLLKKKFGGKLKVIGLKDIPVEIRYETPNTLGTDRVLLAYSVREFYSKSAVLVSAGTALVVDLLLEGAFMGGFITAGVRLKLSSLEEKTEGIPAFEPRRLEVTVGKSTEECVVGGTYLESRFFIERVAKLWSEKFGKNLPLIITGGDGSLFEDMGTYDPLLLHKGLHKLIS
jgi:type III pantothenate kinase